jgi:hypothetical protein
MTKERINDMVDKRITDAFSDGLSIGAVQSELKVRIKNFTTTIIRDGIQLSDLYCKEFSEVQPLRHRYGITYIKHCEKRINDLSWINERRSSFKDQSNSKMFNLIKFKDKILSNINS